MAGLRLGPLLRYVDWETAPRDRLGRGRPAVHRRGALRGRRAAARPAPSRSRATTTPWSRSTGLTPGHRRRRTRCCWTARSVWPLAGLPLPAEHDPHARHVPDDGPYGRLRLLPLGGRRPTGEHDPVGPDALDTLAARLAADPDGRAPRRAAAAGRPGVRGRDVRRDPRAGSRPAATCASRRATRSRTTRSTPASTTSPGSTPRCAGCCPPCPAA